MPDSTCSQRELPDLHSDLCHKDKAPKAPPHLHGCPRACAWAAASARAPFLAWAPAPQQTLVQRSACHPLVTQPAVLNSCGLPCPSTHRPVFGQGDRLTQACLGASGVSPQVPDPRKPHCWNHQEAGHPGAGPCAEGPQTRPGTSPGRAGPGLGLTGGWLMDWHWGGRGHAVPGAECQPLRQSHAGHGCGHGFSGCSGVRRPRSSSSPSHKPASPG